jgi:hypothetical protein
VGLTYQREDPLHSKQKSQFFLRYQREMMKVLIRNKQMKNRE